MTPTKQNLTILQGATFAWPFYFYSDEEVVVPITAITRSYPTTITAAAHGLPATSAVPVALLGVPTWLATDIDDKTTRLLATKVDADTLTVPVDSTSGKAAYTGSAGRLVYNAPMDLSTWAARMQIRESVDSEDVIQEFTDGTGHITVGADGLVQLNLTDTETDALDFTSAVYDLELIDPITDEVLRIATGKVVLSTQVTR